MVDCVYNTSLKYVAGFAKVKTSEDKGGFKRENCLAKKWNSLPCKDLNPLVSGL